MTITTTRRLLTGSWNTDVDAVETAVRRFKTDGAPGNDCQVVMFEMAHDQHLHVNVTHRYQTRIARGWAGPGSLPQGFVHNRTFSAAQPTGQIVRYVREMVLAAAI